MFDQFKQNHGGFGPLQVATNAARGLDWHTLSAAQKQWTATFDAINADDSLPDDFKAHAATVRKGKYPVMQALDILGKMQEQASGIKTVNAGMSNLTDQSASLRKRAGTADDIAQLDVIDTQLSMYQKFANSGDQKLRDVGISGLASTANAMQTFSTTNEAQAIAKQAADDLAKQKFGEQNWSRFQNLNTDTRAQNATFIQQQGAMDRITEIAKLPRSGAGDRALVMNALQVIRPGVLVRGDGSDLDNLEGVDGLLIEDKDYKDLLNVTSASYGAGRKEQFQRNDAVTRAAHAAGLPEELISPLIQPLGESPSFSENPGDPAAKGGDAGAKALALVSGVGAMVPDSVKEGLGIAGGLSVPALLKRFGAATAATGAPGVVAAGVGALAVKSGLDTATNDKVALAVQPGESAAQYQSRVADYLSRRSGEPIDPGSVVRPTDEY